uniref:C2H2-type domain-containing protein n=1 Tax=Parascaris equorum TaxID=6256 RepID=A0A914RND4_PAREQ
MDDSLGELSVLLCDRIDRRNSDDILQFALLYAFLMIGKISTKTLHHVCSAHYALIATSTFILGVTNTSSLSNSATTNEQAVVGNTSTLKKLQLPANSRRFRQRPVPSLRTFAIGGCHPCARTFMNRTVFMYHMHALESSRCVHPILRILHWIPLQYHIFLAGLPYYMCPFCCVTFTEKEVYQAHISIHSQPQSIKCTNYGTLVCAKGMKMQNDKGRILECSHCKEVFAEEDLYNGHVQIHLPSNKLCGRCGKTWSGSGTFPYLFRQETARSSDGKSSERTSASSFRGNSYITSLLSEYSNKKTRGNLYRRSNGKKSATSFTVS